MDADTGNLTLQLAQLLPAFVIGMLGGAHCIGMCGGLMAALSFSVPEGRPRQRLKILLAYNLGRIGSYTLIGALAGWLGYQLAGGQGASVLRVLAGLLLIAMGLYLGSWWYGLTYLERLGGVIWKPLQPLAQKLMPVRSGATALLLGALWGWLPCGLVYTALAYALAQASVPGAAAVMLAFGLGTLPVMLAAGVMAEQLQALMRRRGLRATMAVCVIGFGGWTVWAAVAHGLHGDAMHHAAHPQHQQHPQESSDDDHGSGGMDSGEHRH